MVRTNKEIRAELSIFVKEEISAVKFLQPDGKPKKEWNISYGEEWSNAYQNASFAATGKKPKEVNKKPLEDAANKLAKNPTSILAIFGAAASAVGAAATMDKELKGWNFSLILENQVKKFGLDSIRATYCGTAQETASKVFLKAARKAGWKINDPFLGPSSDAGGDAYKKCYKTILEDCNFPEKASEFKRIDAHWEVWEKGYGLIGEKKGVLYVYCKK